MSRNVVVQPLLDTSSVRTTSIASMTGESRPGMEETFTSVARVVGSLVEIAAVMIVAYGSAEAFIQLLRLVFTRSTSHGQRKVIWRNLAAWLVIGLEFELAADIIGSVVSPTWQDIGELGAIAVVRTFLNYFLEKDLEQVDEAAAASNSLRSDVA